MAKKKAKRREVYIIQLSGQGDIEIKLVDKETFDWLSAPPGRPASGESSWEDPNVPVAVKKRIVDEQKANYEDEEKIYITSGSWKNDRALFAKPVFGSFDHLKEAIQFIQKKNFELVGTFEGYIY